MLDQFSRTKLIIGEEGIEKLQKAKVAVFGIGGVGSFVIEGLVRAGIGNFILVDDDKVCLTNLNRQIIATRETVGKPKVDVAKQRILSINPDANVETYQEFFMIESEDLFDNTVNYVVDCIDTVSSKIELVVRAKKINVPIISCMGTGNKLDPTKFEVTDIYKTKVCPLAKVMRKQLKDRNIDNLRVIYSPEEPIKVNTDSERQVPRKHIICSICCRINYGRRSNKRHNQEVKFSLLLFIWLYIFTKIGTYYN